MRDLVEALKRIDKSELPDDPGATLNDTGSTIAMIPGGRILLDRIEELADRYLIFQSGRLAGEPDHYNQEVLGDEGFRVTDLSKDKYGLYNGGVIHTCKGKIIFG